MFRSICASALALTVMSAASADVTLVTKAPDGAPADGYSYFAKISADGRWALFTSIASNLDPNDSGGRYDVFVADLESGAIHILSKDPVDGSQDGSGGDCGLGDLSDDGRYVVFDCYDTGAIVDGYTKPAGWTDIILYDRDADADGAFDEPGAVTTRVVSVGDDGLPQAYRSSGSSSISGDGRFVAFYTNASFDPLDSGINGDVYVHDRDADEDGIFDEPGAIQTRRASPSNVDESEYPSVSGDGSTVVFQSTAAFDAGDANGTNDVYAYDTATGARERISVGLGGDADGASGGAKVSADGRFVLFLSFATNLVAGDTNGQADVFLRDRQAGTTVRVSVTADGGQTNNISEPIAVSADGKTAYFVSYASNLPGNDGVHHQLYRYDVPTGRVHLLSVSALGVPGNASSFWAEVSADGRYVAVSSAASNLITLDGNGLMSDIFLIDTAVDLSLGLAEAADPALLADGLDYTFSVVNHSGLPATGVEANFAVPAGAAFSSGALDGVACTESAGLVTCARSELAGAATVQGTLSFTTTNTGAYALDGQVIADQEDPVAGNDSASASTTVIDPADVRVQLSAPASVKKGKKFTVSITVTNVGGLAAGAGSVTIAGPVNGALTKVGLIALNGATCAKAKKAPITCTFASLAPGASITGSVVVQSKKLGTASQTVSANAAGDGNPANNSATATVAVIK